MGAYRYNNNRSIIMQELEQLEISLIIIIKLTKFKIKNNNNNNIPDLFGCTDNN